MHFNFLPFFCLFFNFAFASDAATSHACCKAANARCLSCVEGISEREFCLRHPSTCGCPQENVLRMTQTGGWTQWEGDINAKWSEILADGSIEKDGIAAEDLSALGTPNAASSQVVAGTNYKFAFSDGTEVTVLEQPWMPTPIQITNVEKLNQFETEICKNSPDQFCRMLCPKPSCPEQNQCAMRQGHCCDFQCVDPSVVKGELASCTLEDGEIVPSGWNGPGKGDNFCNKCACTDGAFMCTMMACMPRNVFAPPAAGALTPPGMLTPPVPPQLTTYILQGPFDSLVVQEYLDDFEEIFADTLRVDKSVVQSVTVTPADAMETAITVSAFLNPIQADFVKTPEFHSMLQANIESTADDLAKGMGYDTRAANFILEGPWDISAVEANSFELQRQFSLALGIPQNFVDTEITEDDFLVKIDFTAKNSGTKLAALNNPALFEQKLRNQIKADNPALAAILGFNTQPVVPSIPAVPSINTDTQIIETEGSTGSAGILLSAESIKPSFPITFPIIGVVLVGLIMGIAAAKGIEGRCRKMNVNEDVYTDLQTNV